MKILNIYSNKKRLYLHSDYHVSTKYQLKTSSFNWYHETAHAVWSMVKSKDISVRSGLGWDDSSDILKAFT